MTANRSVTRGESEEVEEAPVSSESVLPNKKGEKPSTEEESTNGSVVFVSQQFPPDRSGHASRIHNMATRLSEKGWSVTVLAPPASFPPGAFKRSWQPMATESVEGVTVKRLWSWQPTDTDPGFLSRLSYYILFAIHAFAWLTVRCRRYDVVVTTTPPISTGLAGLPAVLYGRRWVVDVRDLWIDASVSLGFITEGGALERTSRWFQRRVLLAADSITVTTETLGDCLREQYGDRLGSKIQLVPNGVDMSAFQGGEPRDRRSEPIEQEQSGPGDAATGQHRSSTDDQFVVVYTGNIGHAQDLDTCLRALTEVPDEVVLRLVGGGDAVPHLRQLATDLGVSNRVEFVGPVPHEEVPTHLDEANVGIAPLRDDEELAYAMPTKVYEYLGSKLPAVVTGNGELKRFIEDSGGGIHADNNSDSIADAIRTLRDDDELRVESGRSGYEFVRHEYDRDRIASQFDAHLVALTDSDLPTTQSQHQ